MNTVNRKQRGGGDRRGETRRGLEKDNLTDGVEAQALSVELDRGGGEIELKPLESKTKTKSGACAIAVRGFSVLLRSLSLGTHDKGD